MKKYTAPVEAVHPGDLLLEEFMKPLGLSAQAVARAIGATPLAISAITRRKRRVTGEMALRLGHLFGVSPELWLGIQADYDLEVARDRWGAEILKRVQPVNFDQAKAA